MSKLGAEMALLDNISCRHLYRDDIARSYSRYLHLDIDWRKVNAAIMEQVWTRIHQISSRALHMRYGSSVRTRISEINRDGNCPIRIENEVRFTEGREQSSYWGIRR
jgi:hypothetical protein